MASSSSIPKNAARIRSNGNVIVNDEISSRATASTRRTFSRQQPKSKPSDSISDEQMSQEMSSKLSLAGAKGKKKAVETTVDTKLSSMKAVNAASQALSAVLASGWKKSTSNGTSRTTLTTVNNSYSSASKHLAILRELSPGEVDVERAAMSVLGKLIILEMFEHASNFLAETHSRLCSLSKASNPVTSHLEIRQSPCPPTDPTLLNLISTCLVYALIITGTPSNATSNVVEELASTLSSPKAHTFLFWLPAFSTLPTKHVDSLLTRAYSSLNNFCLAISPTSLPPTLTVKPKVQGNVISSPESLFGLRMYALKCLIHTSPGIIEANTFWDQARRYGSQFVKSTATTSEAQATQILLSGYNELVRLAEKRPDKDTYMSVAENGKSFLAFCEYWMAFAKRAGDITTLQEINSLVQRTSLMPSPQAPTTSPATPEVPSRHRDIILGGTNLYNALSELSVLLENRFNNEKEDVNTIQSSLLRVNNLLKTPSTVSILQMSTSRAPQKRSREEEEAMRICNKVDRALEKNRRIALKLLEPKIATPSSRCLTAEIEAALRDFLLRCVSSLESLPSLQICDAPATKDILTRCLDTLFVLSRIQFNSSNSSTFIPVFDLLNRATSILDNVTSSKSLMKLTEDSVDIANYIRCISGSFYNLAGSLYQATRYGNAVPFLVESCSLGAKALRTPRPSSSTPNESQEKEWTQLDEQLFRRWELLAVCYSKNGDRKNAYNFFKQSIHTFPFNSSGLMTQSDTSAVDVIFGSSCSPAVKHLSGLVDRVSYLGACDLLLPPDEVSITSCAASASTSSTTKQTSLDPAVAGLLLERQLDSLEPSRWKEGVRDIFICLLGNALEMYSADMPVRRARVLIRCMEFVYRDQQGDACKSLGFQDAEEMGQQVEGLATLDSFGRDSLLTHFIPQYRIAAHLWSALHTHRRADPNQSDILVQRTDAACQLVKSLLARGFESTTPKATHKGLSPKVVAKVLSPKVAKVGKIVSPRPTRTTRLRVPAAPKKAAPVKTTRSKAKVAAEPVTPKARTRSVLQPVTFDTAQTPPRQSTGGGAQNGKSTLLFDDFERFLSLLQLTARILGMLSLILPKAHLLEMTRKLAQRQMGPMSDGYVIASLDLAHEYATLGRLRRATTIFTQALEIVQSGQTSDVVAVRFLLRFAESLALIEDVPKSSKIYIEAFELSKQLNLEQKAMSTQQRIHARASVLEIAATAAHVFALVRYNKGDIYSSLEGFLQSLRLWNRAVDTLVRLNPAPKPSVPSDLFEMSALKDALPSTESVTSTQPSQESKKSDKRPPMDGLEWRVSEGLLSTLLSLSHTYYLRGSAREAEYFARQAAELSEQLNAPAKMSRALAKQGEIQLHMRNLEDARASLTKAEELLSNHQGIDTAEIRRLFVELKNRMDEQEDEDEYPQFLSDTMTILDELNGAFRQFDNLTFGPRKSLGTSPRSSDHCEVLAPEVLCSILCQQLWAMRDEPGDVFDALLHKLISLSYSSINKAEESSVMAKLTLHGVYDRFRADMFLSSLTESTIAVPIGMVGKEAIRTILSSVEVMDALANAEKLLWEQLRLTAEKGNVVKIREAAISLVLVGAFRTSLGDRRADGPLVMVGLLDISAALTLRRDMLEAIENKVARQAPEDLQWRVLLEDGDQLPPPNDDSAKGRRFVLAPLSDSEDKDGVTIKSSTLQNYWNNIRAKYKSQVLNPSRLASSETVGLPANWTIINICVTPDKSTLFISRQEGGSASPDPLIFCIPLKGRRDHGGEDNEDHLTFDGALQELQDIVRSSDECTKSAANIRPDDEEARSNWWKQRSALDLRMRELLENIEYCWLGAFKTILSAPSKMSLETICELRNQIEKVFHRSLHVKDKRPRSKSSSHNQSTSQYQTNAPTQFSFDDSIVKCFSMLSPKCRDEELEDFVYFVLDLYQFHGVPVAIAEVDIDQVVIDLRTVLEEHRSRESKQQTPPGKSSQNDDEHLFLILDKNVQGLPWESMPVLRGRSVSRIPGIQFLHDRLAFAKMKREAAGLTHSPEEGAVVDPFKGYYILNPSGDLGRTEERFRDWTAAMRNSGWSGVTGKQVSEQQFVDALKTQDLVVYFGHGGGEQYVRSYKIRSLPTCAATMLWGCSSGALRDMGDFDRTGTPYNYMLGGCPALVANLWDVTDKDIDKLSQSVFDKLGLHGKELREKRARTPTSLVAAVAQSRDSCKLKYLTGAAPVVYGIPFYL